MSDDIKITTISKVLDRSEFTDQDAVKKVRGKVTKFYPVNKGEDFEYQNGEFKGEDGGEIRICFSKCTQPDSIKNKTITLTSVKSDQHGWTGIKVLDRKYEKDGEQKVRRELRISPTAKIEIEGGGSSESSGGGGSGRSTNSGGGGGSSQPKFDGHPRLFLEDMIALHFDVSTLVNEKYGEPRPEFIATIFIEAAKNGLAFNYKERASKPAPVKYPPAPTDPHEWKECVMPWGKDGVIGRKLSALEPEKIKEIHIYMDSKKMNTPLAECVYQAARDLKLFEAEEKDKEQQAADDAALDAAPDDIPF